MNLMSPPVSYVAPSSNTRPRLADQTGSSSDPNVLLNHSESPLSNLVRRTSSRRVRQNAAVRDQHNYHTPPIQETREDYYANDADADAYDYNHVYTPHSASSSSSSASHQQEDEGGEGEEVYAYAYQPSVSGSESEQQYDYTRHESMTTNVLDDYYYDGPPVQQMANLHVNGNADTSGHSLLNSNGLPSPLLHSHFARHSYATASSVEGNSYWDPDSSSGARSSTQSDYRRQAAVRDSRAGGGGGEGLGEDVYDEYGRNRYFEDDSSSMYSSGLSGGPALRDSWNSTATGATVRRPDYYIPSADMRGENQLAGGGGSTPVVVVTADGEDGTTTGMGRRPSLLRPGPGRAPIVQPVTANFSKPVRASGQMVHAGESVTPQLPPDMREQKLKVLERNARRGPSPKGSPLSKSVVGSENGAARPSLESVRSTATVTMADKKPAAVGSSLQPRTEPARPISLASLYSSYSYYPYESPAPSPVGGEFGKPGVTFSVPPPSVKVQAATASPAAGRTPHDYLQLGIQHHEANRLGESARCFERSAKEEGGCGVGMLMYGLTLRHGWGCAKNEKVGFKWLMKAAEIAVGDLERVRTGGGGEEVGVVQTELVLAIYEVGQCFFHGWGVPKDQKMAVSYYAVAARLGDGDAQADFAFCLANGKGCKKDKKESARWYRAAVAQGQSDVGLAWIYKDKYQ